MKSHLHLHSDLQPHPADSHLTADQIDNHLVGDLAAAPAAHLAACPLCMERAAAAADPLTSFRAVTMAWSERRSATLPIPDLALKSPIWQRPIVSFAICFSLVLGISIANFTTNFTTNMTTDANQPFAMGTATPQAVSQEAAHSASLQQATIQPTAPVEPSRLASQRDAQLSADNHMLRAIDADLNASSASAAELGIVATVDVASRPTAISSVQD